MRVTGKTPDRVKNVYIQGSRGFSTFHFDDSEGPPKDGIWFHVKGSYATGDTAGSSVVHETPVSFSPPPKRVPPRPSDHPRKRKESVAEFGMMMMMISLVSLQDIQQHIPPRLLELMFKRSKNLNHHLLDPNILRATKILRRGQIQTIGLHLTKLLKLSKV